MVEQGEFPLIEPTYVPETRVNGCSSVEQLPDGTFLITLWAWGTEQGRPVRVIVAKLIRSQVAMHIREMAATAASCAKHNVAFVAH